MGDSVQLLYKDPKVCLTSKCQASPKRRVLDFQSEIQGFNTHWGNILLLDFFVFIHVVKPLMPILAILPISRVS